MWFNSLLTISKFQVKINDEFEAYVWVAISNLKQYDLNPATVKTFKKKGWIDD